LVHQRGVLGVLGLMLNVESVCLLDPDWKLVPQERSLIAEGSASPFYSKL